MFFLLQPYQKVFLVVFILFTGELYARSELTQTTRLEANKASKDLEFAVFCECGKGVFSTLPVSSGPEKEIKKGVIASCLEHYPSLREGRDFVCSKAMPREYVCFINNRYDNSFQFLLQNSPNRTLAVKTAGYDWKDTPGKVQVLGCLDGPLKPEVHLPLLEALGDTILSRCSNELQTLCPGRSKGEHHTISCLLRNQKRFGNRDCKNALSLDQ